MTLSLVAVSGRKGRSRAVFLNLFRAVAHFEGPQIFVVHFNKNYGVIIATSLG